MSEAGSDFGLTALFSMAQPAGAGAGAGQPAAAGNGVMDAAPTDFDMRLAPVSMSGSVATVAQLNAILADWGRINVGNATPLRNLNQQHLSAVILRVVIHCANVGTSSKARFNGARITHDMLNAVPQNEYLEVDDLVDMVKRHCTLRQFAAYYAPLYWNWALENDVAPASWQAKGFTYANRFAGFDFFFGVEASSSIWGAHKRLYRTPTDNERIAAQANSRTLITRATADLAGFQTNIVEVTNGRNLGMRGTLGLLPPATSQNP